VLLFDEAEKAHPRILDLFLQVLEEGRLTDAAGKAVNFSQTILIFTSNAGTDLIYRYLREGKEFGELKSDLFAFLQKSFRVELLNRFDGVVVFSPLSREQIKKIVSIKLENLKKMMAEKEISVTFSETLVEQLAREGFDPALGARPLRRLIQDRLESALARQLLRGEIKKGQAVTYGTEILAETF
jgi:ATP-dependent Clp protease ATP-binding subunit ClpA